MRLIFDMFNSFRALPIWVQIWVSFILVPINAAAVLFCQESNGTLVATLAIAGMAFNLIPMILDRGFSKAMAIPHLIFWIPLVAILVFLVMPNHPNGVYRSFLTGLLLVNSISLGFDIPDAWKWYKGDRAATR